MAIRWRLFKNPRIEQIRIIWLMLSEIRITKERPQRAVWFARDYYDIKFLRNEYGL